MLLTTANQWSDETRDGAPSVALAGEYATLAIPDALAAFKGPAATTRYDMISLEDTFGFDFAECFHTSEEFRGGLIGCASDVGSLFSRQTPTADAVPPYDERLCCKRLEAVLKEHLGGTAPTAEDFIGAFSILCGKSFRWGCFTSFETRRPSSAATYFSKPLPVGALEWHQDWAAAELEHMFGESRTVMFAFPAADAPGDHDGIGVFTELVALTHEFSTESLKTTTPSYRELSTDEQDRRAAAELGVTDKHIVRPRYRRGAEILRYKDAEHLHRSPRSEGGPAGLARQAIWRFQ